MQGFLILGCDMLEGLGVYDSTIHVKKTRALEFRACGLKVGFMQPRGPVDRT